jgi:hypothetical protein
MYAGGKGCDGLSPDVIVRAGIFDLQDAVLGEV